mmetsp:Transcript_10614/g.25931  ORF Transcript_10614/g.25931 Transcript_10614/m.25931 type:complete len:557 (+) Transcript_10614:260-1930(+)|eukprot:CAMPEP_0178983012 /NCGR_PEP_ID=MMETSP0795-20121207/811_1 /TAXON_ID=88552 /ORGANISM="Amoebophrya sp., Strain Ameob2" /LENGTH=556 /DNA_ID=CAMNT_0020673713 /DNA_START=168 /DNA_END=1838 /DNA_ORIENTATION=+
MTLLSQLLPVLPVPLRAIVLPQILILKGTLLRKKKVLFLFSLLLMILTVGKAAAKMVCPGRAQRVERVLSKGSFMAQLIALIQTVCGHVEETTEEADRQADLTDLARALKTALQQHIGGNSRPAPQATVAPQASKEQHEHLRSSISSSASNHCQPRRRSGTLAPRPTMIENDAGCGSDSSSPQAKIAFPTFTAENDDCYTFEEGGLSARVLSENGSDDENEVSHEHDRSASVDEAEDRSSVPTATEPGVCRDERSAEIIMMKPGEQQQSDSLSSTVILSASSAPDSLTATVVSSSSKELQADAHEEEEVHLAEMSSSLQKLDSFALQQDLVENFASRSDGELSDLVEEVFPPAAARTTTVQEQGYGEPSEEPNATVSEDLSVRSQSDHEGSTSTRRQEEGGKSKTGFLVRREKIRIIDEIGTQSQEENSVPVEEPVEENPLGNVGVDPELRVMAAEVEADGEGDEEEDLVGTRTGGEHEGEQSPEKATYLDEEEDETVRNAPINFLDPNIGNFGLWFAQHLNVKYRDQVTTYDSATAEKNASLMGSGDTQDNGGGK